MIKGYLRHFICFSILVISAISTASGQKDTHVVEQGETLYRIARTNNLTVEQLLAANPNITPETLKAGDVLKIPSKTSYNNTVSQKTTKSNPATVATTPSIAVILPFSATGIEGARSLEFYRGFLMGAEKFSKANKPCRIFAYEEGNSETSLSQIIEDMRRNNVQAFIGPVYPNHLKQLADFARSNKTRMVVPFYSRAEQVNTNPYVYLLNTPSKFEQIHMSDLFVCTFKKTTVALMRFTNGDEYDFVSFLKNRLLALGYPVTEFRAEASTTQMLAACKGDAGVVIVPDDSKASSQAAALKAAASIKAANPGQSVSLVGYPSWFEQEKLIPQMNACNTYLFTSNFYNKYDAATSQFEADYAAWFHAKTQNISPRMGLLGYDAAQHLLTGINKWGNDFSTQSSGAKMLQSELRFERTEDEGGLVNSSMFFIHYKPDQTIDKISAPKK